MLISLHRKLPHLVIFDERISDEVPTSKEIAKTFSEVGSRSLKSSIISNGETVYERLFESSLPQKERDSYLLTEIYNVRDLIRHKQLLEQNVDLKLDIMKNEAETKEMINPYYKTSSTKDTTLIFESRFESGNLCLANKVSEWEYNLFMQNDINTQGYTQWFFFQVKNTTAGSSVKFNILNYVFAKT